MQCVECQHENLELVRFCDECGAPLPTSCAACGHVNPPSAKFCNECGAALIVEAGAAAPVRERNAGGFGEERAPQTYTPRYLAEEILTTRSALEGERKFVTVMFADVADSSALAQELDAETLHLLMDRVLKQAANAVHRYEGTVNSYLGDGIMALFGAPIALEDHAVRAVHAALAIQETMRGLTGEIQREYGVAVRFRIGLNTGSVVVGRIGDDLRMDYTANSNVVHLASRMQSLAEPATIVITEDTYRVVAGEVRAERLGPVEIRGQRNPVVVYQLTGRAAWRNRLEIRAEEGLTTLVGRDQELAQLRERLSDAEAGRGQAVAIVGEPGLGKSRLLYEFRRSLGQDRVTWLEGQCRARGLTVPYGPIIEVLRTIFRIEEADGPLQTAQKLREGMQDLDAGLNEAPPFIEPLFGLPGDDAALRGLEPKDRRQRTQQAILQILVASARRCPLVLVFENLHWRDQSSEDLIALLTGSLPELPVLMVTTHRPGYQLRWVDLPCFVEISLDRLADDEMARMATELLGNGVAEDLLRFIAERADGNPLFIEEVTHGLVERNFVVHQPARLQLASVAELEFPSTIQGIIQARIDALGEPVKQDVQIAAVIGREFDLPLLKTASDAPEDEVAEHLETLRRVELIHQTRVLPELEYRFKHAVIQGVAYRSLLGPRRQALHGVVGRSMEQLGRVDQASVLAHHYSQSDRQEKAVRYAILAGDQAARLHANAEAASHYDQALDLARSLPPSPEMHRSQIDAALKRASVGTTREALEADERNLEQAQTLADTLGDEPRMASVLYWLGRLAYVRGMFDRATDFAEQSLAIADRLDDEALAAPPVNLMGRRYYLTGEYTRASRLLARSVEQMRSLGNPTEEATAAGFAGVAYGALGEFERALEYADHGLHLAQELRNPFVEAAAYNYRAVANCHRGSTAAAIADCQEARQIAERAGDRFRIYLVQFYEGQAYAMAGNPAKACELLEASVALAKELGTTTLLAWGQGLLAMTLLALGDAKAAEELCREAIGLAERTQDRFARALAYRTLGQASAILRPCDTAAAESAILEAIGIQREMGCEPELARSHLAFAALLDGWGRAAEAKKQLAQAIELFRRLGMLADLSRAEAMLASVSRGKTKRGSS
ncbi:MAG TPA: AAA family ATPase [Stellaceae bacterium]|nr:AAA family ATPase [Stellaceae bacterium]